MRRAGAIAFPRKRHPYQMRASGPARSVFLGGEQSRRHPESRTVFGRSGAAVIAPRVSVIIVSHGRPSHLNGVVKSLLQQRFPGFEIIVVAEPEALSSAQLDVGVIKTVALSHANISAARNLGIAHAAGEIIAFIDDDARPEPLWLSRLVGPIASGAASAATGRVIGRNGITNQSTCVSVAPNADERTLPFGSKARVFRGECIKLVGTNCAFDAKFLRRLGGFDEGYAFYMDDTDVSMRARNDGASIAYVGDAVVHHGFAAGPLRRQDRVPTSLTKIGHSTARFLSSHCGKRERGYAVEKQTLLQRNRLIQLMIDGLIDPFQVRLLLKQYQAGIDMEPKRIPKKLKPLRALFIRKTMSLSDLPTGDRLGRLRRLRLCQDRVQDCWRVIRPQLCADVRISQCPRNQSKRLEVIHTGIDRRKKCKDKINRLAVYGVKFQWFFETDEQATNLFDALQPRMRQGDPVANACGAEHFSFE